MLSTTSTLKSKLKAVQIRRSAIQKFGNILQIANLNSRKSTSAWLHNWPFHRLAWIMDHAVKTLWTKRSWPCMLTGIQGSFVKQLRQKQVMIFKWLHLNKCSAAILSPWMQITEWPHCKSAENGPRPNLWQASQTPSNWKRFNGCMLGTKDWAMLINPPPRNTATKGSRHHHPLCRFICAAETHWFDLPQDCLWQWFGSWELLQWKWTATGSFLVLTCMHFYYWESQRRIHLSAISNFCSCVPWESDTPWPSTIYFYVRANDWEEHWRNNWIGTRS